MARVLGEERAAKRLRELRYSNIRAREQAAAIFSKPPGVAAVSLAAMASIRKEFAVQAPAHEVWDALRDVGAVHRRLAPGFVTDCRLEGEVRVVTFANGFVAREVIVDVDEGARRVAYSARSERLEHHHASFQVFDDGRVCCRVVWSADVLPHAAAKVVEAMMEEGAAVMRKTLAAHSHGA